MNGRRLAASAALLVLAVLTAACGVGSESQAHRTAPDAVPFGLLEEPEAASAAGPSARTVDVFLLAEGQLVPVARTAPTTAGLDEIAALVASGPTEAERSLGVTSALPADQVATVDQVRGVAQVDLAATFADLNPRDQALAIAQLTYSLTGQPGIGGVTFTLDGATTEVPRGDGKLTTDPLAREDFAALAPGT